MNFSRYYRDAFDPNIIVLINFTGNVLLNEVKVNPLIKEIKFMVRAMSPL